ncbi:MAG: GNAT family N-acetyltransferase [Sulfuricella sp.]|nr:GNAT family N-acetyltransferase [Sulfuricella sp.]
MEIQLNKVGDHSEFRSVPLRNRASVSSKSNITRHYVAVSDGQDIAFVALDIPEHRDYFCVYELFVDPQHRSCGFGAAIIRKCQLLAAQGGFKKICLIPRPIEAGWSEEELRAWYGKLGFTQCPNQSDLVEIVFRDQ